MGIAGKQHILQVGLHKKTGGGALPRDRPNLNRALDSAELS